MKSPAARQTQFQFIERLIPGVPELIVRLDSNPRPWLGEKLHANFLLFDGVAGAERRGAAASQNSGAYEKQSGGAARMRLRNHSTPIVTRKALKQKQCGAISCSGSALGNALIRNYVQKLPETALTNWL